MLTMKHYNTEHAYIEIKLILSNFRSFLSKNVPVLQIDCIHVYYIYNESFIHGTFL